MTGSTINAIDQFIISCRASENIDSLKASLSAFLDSSPVSMMSYHCLAPIGAKNLSSKDPVMTYGIQGDLKETYHHKFYTAVEILLRSDFTFETPVDLSDPRYVSVFNIDQRGFFEMLELRGFKHLCIMRTYGPRNYRGAIFLGFDEKEDWTQTTTLSKIQGVFQAWHVRYIKMQQSQLIQVTLTKREHEVIYWVCMGKSNASIAKIIGISIYTVNGYLRSLFLKLEVNDRVSASLAAHALGLVTRSNPYQET